MAAPAAPALLRAGERRESSCDLAVDIKNAKSASAATAKTAVISAGRSVASGNRRRAGGCGGEKTAGGVTPA